MMAYSFLYLLFEETQWLGVCSCSKAGVLWKSSWRKVNRKKMMVGRRRRRGTRTGVRTWRRYAQVL